MEKKIKQKITLPDTSALAVYNKVKKETTISTYDTQGVLENEYTADGYIPIFLTTVHGDLDIVGSEQQYFSQSQEA